MQRQFTIIFVLVLLSGLTQFTSRADTEAQQILVQSEEKLQRADGFKVSYRAYQNHVAGAPELGLFGSLTLQAGNRFYLTNSGVFFIFDARMECVADGTNYLGVMLGPIQWDRNAIPTNLNKTLVKFLVLAGATPIVASQLKTGMNPDAANAAAWLLPFVTNQFSANDGHLIGNEILEGKELKYFELTWTWNDGTNEPVNMELWLDKSTLLPVKRIMHDRRAGDVIETYTFELNPDVAPDTCDPQRIIRSRKLEEVSAT